jgi:hypothetical protein
MRVSEAALDMVRETAERNRPLLERGGPDPPMNLRSETAEISDSLQESDL